MLFLNIYAHRNHLGSFLKMQTAGPTSRGCEADGPLSLL